MIVKGKFNRERPPILKIDSIHVKYGSEIKYLGLIARGEVKFRAACKIFEKWTCKSHYVYKKDSQRRMEY